MDYTNKNLSRPADVKVESVAKGGVSVKKETFLDKIGKAMVKGAKYTWTELLIPAGKKMISEAGKSFWDSIIYGDSKPMNNMNQNNGPYVSYRGYYNTQPAPKPQYQTYSNQAFDTNSISFEAWIDSDGRSHSGRETAELVLQGLYDILMTYGIAKVSDFYDLAGVSTNGNYQVNKYGWASLTTASVQRIPGSIDTYYIALPKPMPID